LWLPDGRRRHVHHPPETPLGHARHHVPGQPQRSQQEQVDRVPPRAFRHVQDPAGRRPTRVDDEHVDVGHDRDVRVRHVLHQGLDVAAGTLPQPGGRGVERVGPASGDHDPVTGPHERLGRGVPDSGGAATDERGSVDSPRHGVSLAAMSTGSQ
jgi:hypothetical protein